MKIIFIEPDGTGGLIHFAFDLCEALQQEGHQVSLITRTGYELGHLRKSFNAEQIMKLWRNVDRAPPEARRRITYRLFAAARRIGRGVRLTREWARVTRRVLRDRPDAVIFSEIAFPHLAFAPFLMRRAGISTAQICHEFTERDTKSALIASLSLKASEFLFRQFEYIFFLSQATRREFLESVPFKSERTLRIPHGSAEIFGRQRITAAELKHELGIDLAEPVLLYFGYIRPSKGIGDLIEAFSQSAAACRAKLVIAGHVTKFSDLSELEEQVAILGLRDRVVIKASYIPNDEVLAYFDMATAIVLPYRSASQSGVLHLAYGQARPVIATAVGGLAEDVIDGETGILVPAKDTVALARAIDQIINDPVSAQTMGTYAKVLANTRFTWAAAARAITNRLATCYLNHQGQPVAKVAMNYSNADDCKEARAVADGKGVHGPQKNAKSN